MIQRAILGRKDFRFELRPYDHSCASELYLAAIESRKEITPWMAWLHADYQEKDIETWITYCITSWDDQTDYQFVICDREDGRLTGSCGLNEIQKKDLVCNLGYWVRTQKSRLGAATQATLLVRDFGLHTLGLNRLEIVIADGNNGSRRVAEKTGAIYEGLQRRRVKVDDKVYDGHMYAFI